ncbi:glycosyltransferase 87 family protein [Streptomyces acidicola]|uniref:glycosyltransferase 87 family protein n=1 Tax=Streptomyces acidicola TaxID=2596892 RepID=UPI00382C89D9
MVSAVSAGAQYAAMAGIDQSWVHGLDLRIYQGAVDAMLSGEGLYDADPPFNYPPFAAYLFIPLTVGPAGATLALWFVLKSLCLHLLVWHLLGSRPRTAGRRAALTVLVSWGTAFTIDAIGYDLSYGQVNLLLMGLVVYDLCRPDDPAAPARLRGVGTGIAAAVKIVPALFIVHLFLTRQYRAATVATTTFLTTVALGFATLPTTAWRYWTDVLWATERVGASPDSLTNQSLRGLLGRLLHDTGLTTAGWLLSAVAVALAALTLATRLHRRGMELEALTAVGLAVPLVTPLGWVHHWVWLLPATLLLFGWARRRRSVLLWVSAIALFVLANCRAPVLLAVAAGRDPWGRDPWLTSEFSTQLSTVEQVLGANIVLGGLLLLGCGALALRATPDPRPPFPVKEQHEPAVS